MSYNNLIDYEVKDKIAVITLKRSDKLNAFNPQMIEELHHIWNLFGKDDQARVAVITGKGKAFSAGLDIKDQCPVAPAVPEMGVKVTKPIIAAVNGHCIGLGLVLSIMADIRIASENANFAYPEAKVGYTGGNGALLAKRIPLGIAMEMLLSGEGISAQRAYEVGLVNHVVSPDQLMEKSLKMASNIANNAPLVVKALKELALNTDVMEMTGYSNRIISIISDSEDRQEGLNAFKERRKPNFYGK